MTIYAYTDGASRGNPGESGIGVILKDEEGKVLFSGGGFIGTATNNIAEYEALIACLKKVAVLPCKKLIVHSDSELMVRQLLGTYRVKNKKLQEYFLAASRYIKNAPYEFRIVHIERSLNSDADKLANAGIDARASIRI
jgi:ribonuclease HI